MEREMKAAHVPADERAAMRDRLEVKFSDEVEVVRKRIEQQAKSLGFAGKVGLGAASAVTSGINRATFGLPTRALGAVGLTGVQQRVETGQAGLRAAAPASAMAGDVAGFFAPGPLRGLTTGAGKLAAGPLARLAAKDQLVDNMLKRTMAQVGGNVAGGTAAIGATTLTDFTQDASLEQRLDAIGDTLNPTTIPGAVNMGLAVVTGVPQGAIREKVNVAAARAIAEAKRILGPRFRPSPDLARPEGSLGMMFGRLANLPGGRGITQKFLRSAIYEPIDSALKRMNAGLGRQSSKEQAARGLRAIGGTSREKGRIQSLITSKETSAFRQEGKVLLDPEDQTILIGAVKESLKTLSLQDRGRVGQALGGTVGRFMRTIKRAKKEGGTITVQDVEDFRLGLVEAGKLGAKGIQGLSDVDKRVVSTTYRAISETFRQTAPKVSQAHEAAEFLHGLKSLMPNAKMHDAEDVLMAHFKGGNVTSRFKVIERFASKQEVQKLRGWYLAKWVEKVTPKDGGTRLINMPTMMNQFRSNSGMFRKDVFDTVLPGLRREFESLGAISHKVQQGVGAAAGSPTAAGAVVVGTLASVVSAASLVGYAMMGDSALSEKTRNILGTAGGAILGGILVSKTLGSSLGGNIATQLNRGALGQPLYGPTRAAAAANIGTRALTGPIGGQR